MLEAISTIMDDAAALTLMNMPNIVISDPGISGCRSMLLLMPWSCVTSRRTPSDAAQSAGALRADPGCCLRVDLPSHARRPGNPARVALGVNATEESVAELTTTMGLDRPLLAQYGQWLGGLLTGDFGVSLASQQNITAQVIDRAQVSLILVGVALLLALVIAIPLGMWTAQRKASISNALTQLGIAIPSFLVGIILVAIFAVQLGWLPANGWSPPNQGVGSFLSHLVMPVIAWRWCKARF
jgi:ABC-type dipeptide/oligopeptide/nickel transport systems, permease components